MGKLFGVSPSSYVGIANDECYMRASIDYACMIAYFVDENYHYKESQKTAQDEAGEIGHVLQQERDKMTQRG